MLQSQIPPIVPVTPQQAIAALQRIQRPRPCTKHVFDVRGDGYGCACGQLADERWLRGFVQGWAAHGGQLLEVLTEPALERLTAPVPASGAG